MKELKECAHEKAVFWESVKELEECADEKVILCEPAKAAEGVYTKRSFSMRLDKYLKVSRLIKRRTVACDACNAGRVSVNGKPQKASYDVKPGDRIEIRFGERAVLCEVLSTEETVKKDEAKELYRYL